MVILMFWDVFLVFRIFEGILCEFEGKIFENLLYSKDVIFLLDESKVLYIDFKI